MSRRCVNVSFPARPAIGAHLSNTAHKQPGNSRMPEIRVPGMLTLAGLLAGLLLGLVLEGSPALKVMLDVAAPVGDLWLKALKMTILPLVAGLLFTGLVGPPAAAPAAPTAVGEGKRGAV